MQKRFGMISLVLAIVLWGCSHAAWAQPPGVMPNLNSHSFRDADSETLRAQHDEAGRGLEERLRHCTRRPPSTLF